MEKGVNAFKWAPDSSRIAIAAEAPDTKVTKDRKESFGEYHVVHTDYEMVHLWLVDLPKTDAAGRTTASGEPKLLTAGDSFSVDSFAFSPNGKRIAFSAQRDPDLISIFSADIYTVALADGAVKKIVYTPGPDSNPEWSPDGTQIAYVTAGGSKFFFYSNTRIAVVGSEGGTPHVLTSAFDEDANLLRWGPEGMSARSSALGTWKSISLSGITASVLMSHLSSEAASQTTCADLRESEYLNVAMVPAFRP